MDNISVFLFCLLTYIIGVRCDCTFDDGFIGTWSSSDYETITITKSYLTLGSHTFNINTKQTSNWTCHNNETSPYIILRSEVFTLYTDISIAFICMEATQVNNNSIYFYMNSPTNVFIGSERISIFQTALNPSGNATEICTEAPSRAEFISMVRQGSEIDAVTDCPAPLHRNFTYIFNTGSSDKCSSTNGVASFCPDRQQLSIDYDTCSETFMYSGGGSLGCVASIEDSGTFYVSLYNFDSSVNRLSTFQFTCMAVQDTLTGDVSVTFKSETCEPSQTFNTRPTNGGLATLTPDGTCEITTTTTTIPTTTEMETTEMETTEMTTNSTKEVSPNDNSNDSSIWIIIGAVLAGLLLILLLLLLAYCLLRKKPLEQKPPIDKIEDGLVEETDEEEYDAISIDHPEGWNTPRDGPIPPSVGRYLTKDMITQTELLKQMKNIRFKKPPTPPPPTPPPTPPPEPPAPKYLPWPWRTAKRASKKPVAIPQIGSNKFVPMSDNVNDKKNLADYTISKYGIKYDDTGVDIEEEKFARQLNKFIPPKSLMAISIDTIEQPGMTRSNTIASLEEPVTESRASSPEIKSSPVLLRKVNSAASLKSSSQVDGKSFQISSQEPISMNEIQIPSPSTVSNSVPPISGVKLFSDKQYKAANAKTDNHTPSLKRIQMLRALSFGSIGSFSNRTQTDIMMTTDEEDDNREKPKTIEEENFRSSIIDKSGHLTKPIPHYLFPIRSNTVTKLDNKMMKNPLAQNLPRSKTDMKAVVTGENKQKKKTFKKKKKKKNKGESKKSKKNPYKEDLKLVRAPTLAINAKKGSNRIKPCDSQRKKSVEQVFSDKNSPETIGQTTETAPPSSAEHPFLGQKSGTFVAKPDMNVSKIIGTEILPKIQPSSTEFQDSGISADESSIEKLKCEYTTTLPSVSTKKEATSSSLNKDKETMQLPTIEIKHKSSSRPWY